MCRTIVGVSANLCPVDPEGKNLHSSVSSQFAEGIRQAGGLPMVIPMGDPSLVKDYVETIDKLILSGGQNVDPSLYGEEKTIESDDYNIERDQFVNRFNIVLNQGRVSHRDDHWKSTCLTDPFRKLTRHGGMKVFPFRVHRTEISGYSNNCSAHIHSSFILTTTYLTTH